MNIAILTAVATFAIAQPAQADSQGASDGSVLIFDGSIRDERRDGRRIVTVDSLVEYMRNWGFSDDQLIKRLTVNALLHDSTISQLRN